MKSCPVSSWYYTLIMRGSGLVQFLFCTVVFGIAHTQAPLFYSNQNQYFVHGLAWGGFGYLQDDWLANTADPTPLFSLLVAFTYRYLHLSLVYAYYLLALGLYAFMLWRLFTHLTGRAQWSRAGLIFFTLLTLIHAGIVRYFSVLLFGKDYPWFFQAGVANQYILGPGMQPSVAGVLLLASVVMFVEKRIWLAIVLSSLAATIHSTYLLGAAMLTSAYLVVLRQDRGIWKALLFGAVALLLVLPVVAYNVVVFAPTSPKLAGSAEAILAHFRIPHHAEVIRWLDGIAWAQIGWIALGVGLAGRSRLGFIMGATVAAGTLLTFVQLQTDGDFLALLFPWRISAVLIPLATGIVLTRIVQWLAHLRVGSTSLWVTSGTLAALVLAGAAIQIFGLAYHMSDEDLSLLNYVHTHGQADEIYMIPVAAPAKSSHGSASASFLPAPRISEKSEHIPVDLQRFRVLAGAPLYVDFKAIPYKDVEVLEWHRRFEKCRDWYAILHGGAKDLRPPENGVTHIVVPAKFSLSEPDYSIIYEDTAHKLYRVKR